MIIAVSQLIGNGVIISDTRFNESLSIISSYASNDKAVQVTDVVHTLLNVYSCIIFYLNDVQVSDIRIQYIFTAYWKHALTFFVVGQPEGHLDCNNSVQNIL